jgi:hypothetical protein
MFQFAWKLSALDVPDAAAAWYLATVRAEAMEAVPRMMATTKRLKNSFIVSILILYKYGALRNKNKYRFLNRSLCRSEQE